jgi:hypothetical protein
MSEGLKAGEVTNRKTERSYPLQTNKNRMRLLGKL